MNILKSAKRTHNKKNAVTMAVTIVIIVVIIIAVIAGTVVYYQFYLSKSSNKGSSINASSGSGNSTLTSNATAALPSNTTLTVSSDDGEKIALNASQILAMPTASGLGGYCKTVGKVQTPFYLGTYVGVPLQYLCNLVGGIDAQSQIEVASSDGYGYMFTYEDIHNITQGFSGEFYNPNATYQSDGNTFLHSQNATEPMSLILAYGFSNSTYGGVLPDGFNLRVMAVGPEGLVSWGAYSGYWVTSIQISNAPSNPLAFNSCNSAGAAQTSFNTGSNVYFTATGLSASTTYSIYVVPSQKWTVGATILARVSGSASSITTDSSGNVAPTNIYANAVPGKYDIIVKANNDGKFDENDLLITITVSTSAANPSPTPTITSTPIVSSSPTSTASPIPTSTVSPSPSPSPITLSPFILTVTGDTGSITLTQDNITDLPIASGLGGYTKNNGEDYYYLGSYVGVPLQYLCNLVGGIQAQSQIQVSDVNTPPAYGVTLSYTDVTNMPADTLAYPFFNATSEAQQTPSSPVTLIIAYEFSNSSYSGCIPVGTGPLRLMAVDSQGLVTWGTYSTFSVDTIKVSFTPSLSYTTCDGSGSPQSTFSAGSDIYLNASGLYPHSTAATGTKPATTVSYDVEVVPYQSAWTVGMAIPTSVAATTYSTGNSGDLGSGSPVLIYADAAAGRYDIVVKESNETDGTWDAQDLLITEVVSTPGPALLVSTLSLLYAPLVFFAVLVAYKAFKKNITISCVSKRHECYNALKERLEMKVLKSPENLFDREYPDFFIFKNNLVRLVD